MEFRIRADGGRTVIIQTPEPGRGQTKIPIPKATITVLGRDGTVLAGSGLQIPVAELKRLGRAL